MSKKNRGARYLKDQEARAALADLRAKLKANIAATEQHRRQLGYYIKLGQDLYITCNSWLFTGDTKTDTAKLADAVEALLQCRKYSSGILMSYQALAITASETQKYLKELRETGDVLKIANDWMSNVLPRATAVGESVAVACLELKPVLEKYGATIGDGSALLLNNLKRAVEDAESNLELMQAANLNNVSPEEEAAATKLMEEALAESEASVSGDPTIPTMEQKSTLAPEDQPEDKPAEPMDIDESAAQSPQTQDDGAPALSSVPTGQN